MIILKPLIHFSLSPMNKSDIIHLALIILGITIIIRALLSIVEQIGFYSTFSEEISNDYNWLIIQAIGLAIVLIIGWYFIMRSSPLSKRLAKGNDQHQQQINMDKNEIIHVAVIILCLFFVVQLFGSFFNAVYSVIQGLFDRYSGDHYPEHLWILILYFSLIFILIHSKKFSTWMIDKVIK
jgi:hypothetical protein